MPRGQLLSYEKKVTRSSLQPIIHRLWLEFSGKPCTGAVDQVKDLDSTAKIHLREPLCFPLRILS